VAQNSACVSPTLGTLTVVSLSLPPVTDDAFVWLHGFTQTGESASAYRSILAGSCNLVTPDLPSHGVNRSNHRSLVEAADEMASWIPEGCALGGYSLGARLALHIALRHPEKVRRLVLIGPGLGLSDATARARRRDADEGVARAILEQGVNDFLDNWNALPLFGGLRHDPDERVSRLANSAEGLAASLRTMGLGTQDDLRPHLGQLTMPTLALAGAADNRFVEQVVALSRVAPRGRLGLIPGASHAAHLMQPALVAEAVRSFLIA
jgi:2-succinyl-6-hydroxy-2,4-cyclohexadiene-1-carboxylate synthase